MYQENLSNSWSFWCDAWRREKFRERDGHVHGCC